MRARPFGIAGLIQQLAEDVVGFTVLRSGTERLLEPVDGRARILILEVPDRHVVEHLGVVRGDREGAVEVQLCGLVLLAYGVQGGEAEERRQVLRVTIEGEAPLVLGVLVVYVIVGLTRLLSRLPLLGRMLPGKLAYALSMLLIGAGFAFAAYLAVANVDGVIARGPLYQESLLASIQQLAVRLGVETEPTWISLRQDLLAQINVQRVIGSTVASVTSILVGLVVVFLYASFLLLELRHFPAKLAGLSSDPQRVDRVRKVTHDINARIGSYLALKTVLSLLLGAVCWVIMTLMGLEFALFWAVLITLLNYVPYIGSFLGVALPAAMAIVQFADVRTVAMLLVYLSVAQFAIGNFLEPYVMGNSLNLSPFAILVSLTVWSGLWGIAGAFLAVPITSILTIVLAGFAGTRPIAVLLSRDGRV